MGLTKEDIEILSRKFDDKILGVKVQATAPKENPTAAMLVLYLQHTDVYARLEEVDPAWTCEVLHEVSHGKSYSVSMKMTVKGVSRQNIGEGEDPKSAYSDALKRVAMLFGVGRYLYDAEQVWVPYNKERDKRREWAVADYWNACKRKPQKGVTQQPPQQPVKPAPQAAPAQPSKPATSTGGYVITQKQINRLWKIASVNKWTNDQVHEFLKSKFGIASVKDLTKDPYDVICTTMEKGRAS